MRSSIARRCIVRITPLVEVVVLSGCVLAPPEARIEQQAMTRAGVPYRHTFEQRELPALPEAPTWQEVLHRAFLANGELESAYDDWAAAVWRVQQAGTWPNTNLALSFSYMFSGEHMKSWDRTTVSAQPDPMQNLSLPQKVQQSARVALDNAQAAGARFTAAKFALQRKVLVAWLDYTLAAERARVRREDVSLLRLTAETESSRVQAGGSQQDLLRAQIAAAMAEDELRRLDADLAQQRAMLNAMLARPPDAPLAPPAQLPAPRPLPIDDAGLLALAAQRNPELAATAHEVRGRADALELARLQYLPDINPTAGFTGGISQAVGLGLSLPIVRLPQLEGMVKEAQAMQQGAEARYRQLRLDKSAMVVAALVARRDAERQVELLEGSVLPLAESVQASTRQAYAASTGTFRDLIDARRTVLDVRLMIAEAKIAREKRLAELEELTATDAETLRASPTSSPASQPGATPASANTETNHE